MKVKLSRHATRIGAPLVAAAAIATLAYTTGGPTVATAKEDKRSSDRTPAEVEVLAPESGHHAGIGGKGWFVDLEVEFDTPLEATGFTAEQLTGPGVHNNAPPFPGSFSAGQDDRLPGLVVLVSTTQTTRADGSPTGFTGPGQNVANLFNLTGITDRTSHSTEVWDTWIVGAPLFGLDTKSTVYAAVAADANGDGVFNDAPNSVPDADSDGDVDRKDLRASGVASNIEKVKFFIAD